MKLFYTLDPSEKSLKRSAFYVLNYVLVPWSGCRFQKNNKDSNHAGLGGLKMLRKEQKKKKKRGQICTAMNPCPKNYMRPLFR